MLDPRSVAVLAMLAALPSALLGATPETGRRIEGIVVDGEGRPLANTAIWIRSSFQAEGDAFLQRGPRQITGADGRFSILVPTSSSFDLYACRRDRSQFMRPLQEALPQPLRIVLPASGRIPGRIVDERGHPVPGARVSAGLLGGGPVGDLIDPYHPCPRTDGFASAVADADGRFVLEPIAAGRFELRASADHFAPYARGGVELGGEKGLRSLDIVLQPREGGRDPGNR